MEPTRDMIKAVETELIHLYGDAVTNRPEPATDWAARELCKAILHGIQPPTNNQLFHAMAMDRHTDTTMTHLLGDLDDVAKNYSELLNRMRRHWEHVVQANAMRRDSQQVPITNDEVMGPTAQALGDEVMLRMPGHKAITLDRRQVAVLASLIENDGGVIQWPRMDIAVIHDHNGPKVQILEDGQAVWQAVVHKAMAAEVLYGMAGL